MWEMLMGPVDQLLQFTDEKSFWINFPVAEIWEAFWSCMQIIFDLMDNDEVWDQCFHGSLVRLLPPDQRLSVHLDQIDDHYPADRVVWVSAGATLQVVGGISWGDHEFFRSDPRDMAALIHPITQEACRIGECELIAATMAIFCWSLRGKRNILLCTDNQNVL